MKRIPTLLEFSVSTILTVLGMYVVYEGFLNNSPSGSGPALIGGAVCLILGVMILVRSVRSLLWHRRMLRESRTGPLRTITHD